MTSGKRKISPNRNCPPDPDPKTMTPLAVLIRKLKIEILTETFRTFISRGIRKETGTGTGKGKEIETGIGIAGKNVIEAHSTTKKIATGTEKETETEIETETETSVERETESQTEIETEINVESQTESETENEKENESENEKGKEKKTTTETTKRSVEKQKSRPRTSSARKKSCLQASRRP